MRVIDWVVSKITYNVLMGTPKLTHSLTYLLTVSARHGRAATAKVHYGIGLGLGLGLAIGGPSLWRPQTSLTVCAVQVIVTYVVLTYFL